jgi:hypothetical protein
MLKSSECFSLTCARKRLPNFPQPDSLATQQIVQPKPFSMDSSLLLFRYEVFSSRVRLSNLGSGMRLVSVPSISGSSSCRRSQTQCQAVKLVLSTLADLP